MNETLSILFRRRSTRAYSTDSVTQTEKDAILQAAMRAPTAGNMMLYTIIEVEDQAVKDRLAVTCDDQPFIAKAPYVLLFLADYQRWFDFYNQSGGLERCLELGRTPRNPAVGDLMLASQDALIAAQTAVIAAESLGIGSCYIGDILEQYEVHRQMFDLPKYVLPVALVCFGRPLRDPESGNLVSRFEREFIVHKNRYQRQDASALERMFAPMQARFTASGGPAAGAQNVGQANYLRKFTADFSIEMSRSVRAMIDAWEQGEE
jgi:nitroreductase